MSDGDSDSTKSTKSEEGTTQQRPRKKTSDSSGSTQKSRSSSQESSGGTRRASSKSSESSSSRSAEQPSSSRRRTARLSAVGASKKAIEQFGKLTGRSPESVVGVKKSDEGWNVTLEVVEARRVPDTADLLAEYDIDLDSSGELLSYERINRYVRGRPDA